MSKFKKIAYTVGISFLSIIFVLIIKSDGLYEDTLSTESNLKDGLAFAVLGDTHENTKKLKAAISDLHNIDASTDAIVLNGDTVDQGIEQQYKSIEKTLKESLRLLPKEIIKNIGNHEFFDYDIGTNNQSDVEKFLERYFQFSGENTVYHDSWIKGYHFISLGSETGNTEVLGSVKAFISEKQQQWLSDKLAERYEKGKPIFVFLHQHLNNNMKGWIGVEQGEELMKILASYPEVVIFASHTHASPESNAVTIGQPFTMVQTGAIHYTIVRDDKGERKNLYDASYGVYVKVQDKKVTIKGRNFVNKTWIYSQEINN